MAKVNVKEQGYYFKCRKPVIDFIASLDRSYNAVMYHEGLTDRGEPFSRTGYHLGKATLVVGMDATERGLMLEESKPISITVSTHGTLDKRVTKLLADLEKNAFAKIL